MNDTRIKTIEQVREFLAGNSAVEFSISAKDECYSWIEQILIRFGYRNRGKAEKGLLLDLIGKVSGYSRIQIKRLVKQYSDTGRIKRRKSISKGFTVLPVLAYLVDSAVRSFAPKGYVYQPRVAAQQLLWEGNAQRSNPNGVA
uniref:Uncharacterized protein n=1 Tax=Candidatus Kentrum sp. TUN TaxID=2126343 RepID=A0A451B2N2_9GAMM|nr:MAG: hypothetical protein BECKTUN1418F_GA0071002_14681 [Candidatus Kentron sp. TUN]VFK72536.1 MAG: hypothetical protein BECKTUN1418E_GA0071001_14381 [Candidatus Kentron sp. TUN]